MAREYYKFGKKHFEYGIREQLISNRLGFLKDITNEYIAEGNDTWEHIYAITTANKSVDILIYSSVDMRTGFAREHGDDAVRLVMRWKTKNGYMYKKLAKHLRISTLFLNMKKTVECAQQTVFKLEYKEFTREI